MSLKPPNERVLDGIPAPQAVRESLAQNLRDNRVLRQLLRLSELAAREGGRRTIPSKPSVQETTSAFESAEVQRD